MIKVKKLLAMAVFTAFVMTMFVPVTPAFAAISAFSTIQAESYNAQSGISVETCSDTGGGQNAYDWQNNGYLRYDNVDFGSTGALGFQARVADFSDDCDIKIILDSLTNTPVGTFHLFSTGKEQDWETQSCPISKVTGVHTVYLKFEKNYAKASLNHFTFLTSSPAAQVIPSYSYTSLGSGWQGRDTKPDTWVSTDSPGNKLATNYDSGNKRSGKYVGIFYHVFLSRKQGSVYDNSQILSQNYFNPAYGPNYTDHFWGKPIFDYYRNQDEYVIRRHAQLLYNAGVDVIILDTSNAGFPFEPTWEKIFDVFYRMRLEGSNTPQIAFHTGDDTTNADKLVPVLYNNLYSQNKYSELWFKWEGKPLILANGSTLSATLQNYFTFRRSWAWQNGQNQWPWLDNAPQGFGWHTASNVPEATSVCLAQHVTTNKGKSIYKDQQPVNPTQSETASLKNFDEQWKRALEIDPQFIFVTAWNEWVGSRYPAKAGDTMGGRPLAVGDPLFIDEYNPEYSRDIEPVDGFLADNAYMKMAHYIRLFKGARNVEQASGQNTITINTDFAQWNNVGPGYTDTLYDTYQRNEMAYANYTTLTNTTGRNDIDTVKVSHDATNLYFYAKTRSSITTPSGSNWMALLLDTDNNKQTGWNGYDYILNRSLVNGTTGKLQRNSGGTWSWTDVANITFSVSGNQMHMVVPRSSLGLTADPLKFQFKWADNITESGNIMEFYNIGDVAPDGRFNYQYVEQTGSTVAARPSKSSFAEPPAESGFAKYEAELGARAGSVTIANDHTSFGGMGFTAGWDTLNNSVTFNINSPIAGIRQIKIRYANGNTGARTLSLYVNGSKVKQMSFPIVASGNWDAWGTITENVSLNSGQNTVMIKYDSGDNGLINVDYIAVSEDAFGYYEAEIGTRSGGVNVNTNHSGYTGTGFTDNWSAVGASDTITVNVPKSNVYNLKVRFANGQTSEKTLSVYVNGTKVGRIPFYVVAVGNWDAWADVVYYDIRLNAGSNTIKLQYDSGDTGNINIDSIGVLSDWYTDFEAESGTRSGGVAVNTNHAGYSGTGFTENYAAVGASNTVTVTAAVTGYHHLKVRYANGQAGARTLSLYVNGTKVKQISFPVVAPANWDVWGDMISTYSLKLNAGSNTIKLQYDSGDSGGINIDYIGIQ